MKTPAIQNDFSYYRRTVSRQRIENTSQMLVSTELANRMSLFYAHATPMLKVLSEATSKFVSDNANDVDNTTETLGTMAKVCLRMLENPWVCAKERLNTKVDPSIRSICIYFCRKNFDCIFGVLKFVLHSTVLSQHRLDTESCTRSSRGKRMI